MRAGANLPVRQIFFTESHYDTFLPPKITPFPAHLPHFMSASSSLSPSPFPAPSRASTTEQREETVHTAMISAADKGNHTPLYCEDESRANPVPPGETTNTRGDIEICSVTIEPKAQHRVSLCSLVPTPTSRCTLLTPIARAPYRYVGPYAPFCLYTYNM